MIKKKLISFLRNAIAALILIALFLGVSKGKTQISKPKPVKMPEIKKEIDIKKIKAPKVEVPQGYVPQSYEEWQRQNGY